MGETAITLNGELSPWPTKERLASILNAAGLRVTVGRCSVRLEDFSHFVFQEYGGDFGDPVIDADAASVDEMMHVAGRVSQALAAADVRHRFGIYCDDDVLIIYFHHRWPMGDIVDPTPSFAAGLDKAMSNRRWWISRALVLAAIIFIIWQLFGVHVDKPEGFITASQAAAYTGAPLPPEARNIRVAGYRHWIEVAQYVRFEAPPDVCLAYAEKVIAPSPLKPLEDAHSLAKQAKPLQEGAFGDFSWFDLAKATNVVSGDGHNELFVSVWVDRDRGVFYCRRSD